MSQPETKSFFYGVAAVASAISLYAALGHPSDYGFYTLTRFAVTAASILFAVSIPQANSEARVAFWIVAGLFNPIIPLGLGRGLWFILDIAVCPLLFYGASQASQTKSEGSEKL